MPTFDWTQLKDDFDGMREEFDLAIKEGWLEAFFNLFKRRDAGERSRFPEWNIVPIVDPRTNPPTYYSARCCDDFCDVFDNGRITSQGLIVGHDLPVGAFMKLERLRRLREISYSTWMAYQRREEAA